MGGAPRAASVWRFGAFEIEGRTAELRRNGIAVKLQDQPAQLLLFLLEHAGEIVTREELRQKLWAADTFVDFDHALNTATMKLREALGDTRDRPLYIQTIPRKGYRFVAPVTELPAVHAPDAEPVQVPPPEMELPRTAGERPYLGPDARGGGEIDGSTAVLPGKVSADNVAAAARGETSRGRGRGLRVALVSAAVLMLGGAGALVYRGTSNPGASARSLTRLTFDEGLQSDPTWSPDGRYLAYSSDKGGTTNIWVQQISGGDPIQVTRGPGPNWQPDWSPDGRYIAYRSEAGASGIFIVPALGGARQERMIAPFGYYPRWSPDSSQVLFRSGPLLWNGVGSFDVVGLDGGPPRKALGNFLETHEQMGGTSAAWHPDGLRVTIWAEDATRSGPTPSFWTVPLEGGVAVHTDVAAAINSRFAELAVPSGNEWMDDAKFTWAPTGDALYLERTLRGARSLWRLAIDPKSLRATGLERLTTGGSLDTSPAISPDGKRLAFTAASGKISAWMYPLDANHGNIVGNGRAVTSSGLDAWFTAISRDSSKLVFSGVRAGEQRLWMKSLPDGPEAPLFVDQYFRNMAQWSPDGKHLAYRRTQHGSEASQIMLWSEESGQEEPLTSSDTSARTEAELVYDWSPDGKTILITKAMLAGDPREMGNEPLGQFHQVAAWQVPIVAAPQAELREHRIISDPRYEIYQEHFSPDGQWIVFEAVRTPGTPTDMENSSLYVTRSSGGPWITLVDEKPWADKPRWSPDGRTIYFLSARGSFFNVWAIRFDPETGQRVGEPFRITKLDSPSLSIPGHMGTFEISVSEKALVLTLAQVTGGIWMLDNVDR